MNWKLALRECRRHLSFTCVVVLLLVMIFATMCVVSSVIKYRFRIYSTFQEEVESDGKFMILQGGQVGDKLVKKREELQDKLKGVKRIEAMYQLSEMTFQKYYRIQGWAYDEELLQAYEPKMAQGNWLTPELAKKDRLQAVISANSNGVEAGDVIEITEPNYGIRIEVEIVGVLAEDAKVVGVDQSATRSGTLNDCLVTIQELQNTGIYSPGSDVEAVYPALFFLNEQLTKNRYFDETAGGDGKGIQRVMAGPAFIIYEDGITQKESEQNEEVYLESQLIQNIEISQLREKTLEFIFEQLRTVFPLLLSVLLLTFVAVFSVEVLSVKEQLHHYAIYYITGMRWGDCIKINLCHEILLHAIAVALFLLCYAVGYAAGWFDTGLIRLNGIMMGLIAGLCLLDCTMSLIAPRWMLKRTQAVTLLHENV